VSARAGIGRRFAASVYEALLLSALALLVGFALLPVLSPTSPPASRALAPLGSVAQAISFCALVLVLGAYCVWGWSGGRRTLPMKTWRLALESVSGLHASLARAGVRYAAWWIGPALAVAAYAMLRPSGHGRWAIALLAINYAWAVLNRDRQFLHDQVAGTRLVLVGS
jgi:uncharacterized RDD family membrane protein YckC